MNSALLGGGKAGDAVLSAVLAHEGSHAYGEKVEANAYKVTDEAYKEVLDRYGIKGDREFADAIKRGINALENQVAHEGAVHYMEDYPQYFDAENYANHQLNALGTGFYIAYRQAKSHIGNFFANLFTGKGDIGICSSGSLQICDISYGCTITGTIKKGFSIEFDDLKSAGLSSIQNVFNESPITLNVDGITAQYKIVKATVSVKSSDASFKLELTTGKKLKAGEASAGVIVSAPYKDGPCATIENRKSKSLNNAVDYYQYINSPRFYLENWGTGD